MESTDLKNKGHRTSSYISNRVLLRVIIAALVLPGIFHFQCSSPVSTHDDAYSFFVVGHAYGNPTEFQYGFYPPLNDYFDEIANDPKVSFGILTGDVVPKNTQAYWDSAIMDLDRLGIPVHIAPGNHDRGEIFYSMVEHPYHAFVKTGDLFIVLDTEDWMVDGDQKDFLFKTLDTTTYARNIFIFSHELVWWSPNNKYHKVEINYRPHFPGQTNFWNDILPKLQIIDKPVYWFAGDVGSKPECTPVIFSREDNVTLIANGVGGGEMDNLIYIDVSTNGKVSFRIIHLNDPVYSELGKAGDFLLE